MLSKVKNGPLNNKEIDQLEDLLIKYKCHVSGVSMLQGFFAAIVCTHQEIPPSYFLPEIWGKEEPNFDSRDEAEYFLILISRLLNDVSTTLIAKTFFPLLPFAENDEPIFREWVEGFVSGMALVPESWHKLAKDTDNCFLLSPIYMLHSEKAKDYDLPPLENILQSREPILLLGDLGLSIIGIYTYFSLNCSHCNRPTVSRNER